MRLAYFSIRYLSLLLAKNYITKLPKTRKSNRRLGRWEIRLLPKNKDGFKGEDILLVSHLPSTISMIQKISNFYLFVRVPSGG